VWYNGHSSSEFISSNFDDMFGGDFYAKAEFWQFRGIQFYACIPNYETTFQNSSKFFKRECPMTPTPILSSGELRSTQSVLHPDVQAFSAMDLHLMAFLKHFPQWTCI